MVRNDERAALAWSRAVLDGRTCRIKSLSLANKRRLKVTLCNGVFAWVDLGDEARAAFEAASRGAGGGAVGAGGGAGGDGGVNC
mmetsp:Transcript_45911/g.146554  ORF Transcript_45911/g.146554 Transcript_45911/m.146554 type:complete len:84 (+) Transcript_45911:165-416(+)